MLNRKSRSQNRSKSKTKLQTTKNSSPSPLKKILLPYEELDDKLDEITLKKPAHKFSIFLREEYQKYIKDKPGNLLPKVAKLCKEKWSKMTKAQKEKWNDLSKEEKIKFERDCEYVKHFLLGYNEQRSTSFEIFLDNKLKEGFEKNEDPKETKKQAIIEWSRMNNLQKLKWEKLKKENDTWWDKLKELKNVNAYTIYVQEQIEKAKNIGDTVTFQEVSEKWNKMTIIDQNKYIKKAKDIIEEKERFKDIYEIVNDIRPSKPLDAYSIFLKEKLKENVLNRNNIHSHGRKIWNELSKDEKDEYLKKAKKQSIIFKYKMILFKKNLKDKIFKIAKRPNIINIFCSEYKKKGKKCPKGKKYNDWISEEYNKLSQKEKDEYVEKLKIAKIEYEKKIEETKNSEQIYKEPKKNATAFNFFFRDKMKIYKSENPHVKIADISPLIDQEWNELSENEKIVYEKKEEEDKVRYETERKEFLVRGYYKSNVNTEKYGRKGRQKSHCRTSSKRQCDKKEQKSKSFK